MIEEIKFQLNELINGSFISNITIYEKPDPNII